MKIKYSMNADDIRIYAGYMYGKSSTLRRHRIKTLALMTVAMLATYFVAFRSDGPYVALYWVVFSVLFILIMDIYSRRSYIRNAVRMYREREQGQESRSSTLTITDKGLAAKSEDATVDLEWQGISSIVELDDRTYIFLNALDAVIIPRDKVESGDYKTFVAAVKEGWTPVPHQER